VKPAPASEPQPSTEPQRYELWRPVIGVERRHAIERAHQELAAEWSQVLLDRVDPAEAVVFEGVGFEEFGRLCHAVKTAEVAFFEIERTSVAGMVMLGIDLARYLVDSRFGASPEQPEAIDGQFSRLEVGLLRQVLDQLLERLSNAYAKAGIGSLRLTRACEQAEEMRLFAPDDCLIIFRFRIGDHSSALKFSIAARVDLVNMFNEVTPAPCLARPSEKVAQIVRQVPIVARVVLGLWRVPLREIVALKPGDSIVLPDGADSWLEASGMRLGRVKARIDGAGLIVTAPEANSNGDQ
jgi:flagellar motor switch protein FliM